AELLNVEQKVIEFRFARKGYAEMLGYLIGEQLSEDIELLKPVVEESVLLQPVNRPEFSLYASQRQLVDTQLKMIKIGNMPKVGFL
ncbi:transporter, partial [Acinetobacter baumannii]